ncbi:MAG: hypothetical protein ACI3ZQ_07695 [Candidatus Cryptobacteroides sp.]
MGNKKHKRKPSMRRKLVLSLGAIGTILLLSCVISVVEYGRMSNYESKIIAANINHIYAFSEISVFVEDYNSKILAAIGDDSKEVGPHFDTEGVHVLIDSLKNNLRSSELIATADSMEHAYHDYMETAAKFSAVSDSAFVDVREWYFATLQPKYKNLNDSFVTLDKAIFDEVKTNAEHFDESFYRGITPALVAVGAGLLLILLLLFFILTDYVKPIYKISEGIDNYRSIARPYNYTFDGDDQLKNISNGVADLIDENIELKKRIRALKDKINKTETRE